jgi:hypothetical protein
MGPDQPLPLPGSFSDPDVYVASLLNFCTTSSLLQTLCGGVHILDFLTRSPELYSVILPEQWRNWFEGVGINDVLDLLMREDLSKFYGLDKAESHWRGYQLPPLSFVQYIQEVRKHLLRRDFVLSDHGCAQQRPGKQVFMGMNPKKVHEVDNFAKYVDDLVSQLKQTEDGSITHLADFGAGQNYLGRVLASKPYNRHIVAIESRAHVVAGARNLDIHSKLTKKPPVVRNKKAYRAALAAGDYEGLDCLDTTQDSAEPPKSNSKPHVADETCPVSTMEGKVKVQVSLEMRPVMERSKDGTGQVQYVEHRIKNGDLSSVIEQITRYGDVLSGEPLASVNGTTTNAADPPSLLVMSLHSCGNLVHHGLRTLTLNSSVRAVAMIGCCYNLMTERLGPPTHKLHLRPQHPRLDATSGTHDPQGFPMSERFATYQHQSLSPKDFSCGDDSEHRAYASGALTEAAQGKVNQASIIEEGIRLNITARMMAVQAPQNWTEVESSSFFTRHFFRALLQRVFLDKRVISAPPSKLNGDNNMGCSPAGSSWGMAGGDGEGTLPVVIGNLKKRCYESFVLYVRGAVDKLAAGGGAVAQVVEERVGSMGDDEILAYESHYKDRKKELSIVWSLMAFSAQVVEAMVVVDRWLWLKEQPSVKHAWVEPVFDYAKSPRNLVVVGVKH